MHARDDDGIRHITKCRSNRSLSPVVDIQELRQWAEHTGQSISCCSEVSPSVHTTEPELECLHACGNGGSVTFGGRLTVTQILDSRVSRNKS